MPEVVLRPETSEADELSQLRCQVIMLENEVKFLSDQLVMAERRDAALSAKISKLMWPAGPINPDVKLALDEYLEEEQQISGWVKFEHVRNRLGMDKSQWSRFKRNLMAAYPDEYQERTRQVPKKGRGRRPMEFRRVACD